MKSSDSFWYRYAGMGFEFAAAFGAFVALGWWIGKHFDWNPWATVVGAGLGLIGSMTNLIREALRLQREVASRERESGSRGSNGPSSDHRGSDSTR